MSYHIRTHTKPQNDQIGVHHRVHFFSAIGDDASTCSHNQPIIKPSTILKLTQIKKAIWAKESTNRKASKVTMKKIRSNENSIGCLVTEAVAHDEQLMTESQILSYSLQNQKYILPSR